LKKQKRKIFILPFPTKSSAGTQSALRLNERLVGFLAIFILALLQ
jgi:hypothetical protein